MYNMSSNFRVSCFRNWLFAWIMLTVLCVSFLPSVSHAQQPMATILTLSGTVLVNAQERGKGTILTAGDVIETQAGASVVLELSDGSQLELGENTKVDIAVLSQIAVGARVSRVKLLWGQIRTFLSPQNQIEGSSFDIETPNALIGVKFSEPDIEVSYNLERAETVGIAHTVELMAKNLVTNEEVLVPVGSSVIVTTVGIKVVAGIVGVVGSSGAGSTGTGTASTTTGTGSTGMGTGTKVAIGVGSAAAAGGIAALAVSSGDGTDGDSPTTESTEDLSGTWVFTGSCVGQGCTEHTPCMGHAPNLCGTSVCDICEIGGKTLLVRQSGNTLSWYSSRPVDLYGNIAFLNGVVSDGSVSFTTRYNFGIGVPIGFPDHTNTFTGVIDGNTINGEFSGSVSWTTPDARTETATWTGTFTVTIRK